MKTNHQRRYKANVDSPRHWIGEILVSWDSTKGNRGLSRIRHGLKKFWNKKEKREAIKNIRNEIKELNEDY